MKEHKKRKNTNSDSTSFTASKHPELADNYVFYRCTYCNKTFAHKISLNDHIIKMHPDFIASVSSKIHECAKCTYKTTISSKLTEHMTKHPDLASNCVLIRCTYCNKTFVRKTLLNEHITKKHPDFIASVSCKVHECTKCSFKTTRIRNFKEHMVVHHELAGSRIFNRCIYCNETFAHKTSLNDHITKKHPDFIASVRSKIHECTKCTYKTTKKTLLNNHITKKHPDFIASVSCKVHECTKCTYKTTRSSYLKDHMAKHPELADNCVFCRCTYCNKTFASKTVLNEHITKKHPDFIASVSCKVHECTKCSFKTTSKLSLNDHITKKHPDFIASVSSKIHECTKCTYKTTRSSNFRDHMAKHHELAGNCVIIRCTYCNKTFAYKKSLDDHITKKHPDFIASVSSKVHECTKCTYKTTRRALQNEHITQKHPDFIASVSCKVHECTKCTYKTTMSGRLKEHMAKHPELAGSNHIFNRCTYCNKIFTRKSLLNEHITKQHPDFIASLSCKVHECTKCSFKTTRNSNLKGHMVVHPELVANRVVTRCPYCDETFVHKKSLNEHITKKHPDFIASLSCKVHECTKCSFKTTINSILKEHIAVHSGLVGNRVLNRCPYCDETFVHKKSLNEHITKKHPDFIATLSCKVHECTKCTYKTTMTSRLKEHMVKHPEPVSCRIHECTKCTYKTTMSSKLKEHMAKHPELGVFSKCTYCSTTFTRKALLNEHIIKKHPECIASVSCKIHECTKCAFKTTMSRSLREHMVKHPELAGYCVFSRCAYCNKTFAYKALLNEHIIKQHPEFIASVSCKMYECTKCTYKTTIGSSRLTRHIQVKHPELAGNDIFSKCRYCNKTFSRKELLNQHIIKKHPDFIASLNCKIHECTKCTYKTTRGCNLRDHMAKHHDLAGICVLYSCSYCNKTFAQKSSLNEHIVRKHPDFIALDSSKIHECTKCTYKTTRSRRLKEHMAIHNDLAGICVLNM
nr:unnamed protein product [Callosobruchus analis]